MSDLTTQPLLMTAANGEAAALRGAFDAGECARSIGMPVVRDTGQRIEIRGPGVDIAIDPARVRHHVAAGVVALATGEPRVFATDGNSLRAVVEQLRAGGVAGFDHLRGRYAIVLIDLEHAALMLATDRFGVHPMCYWADGNRLSFADRADSVDGGAHPIDPQALFNYVYFHMIPAPRTAFVGVHRLPPASYVRFDRSGLRSGRTWRPVFTSIERTTTDRLENEFRSCLEAAVRRELDHSKIGCFLSGGTDSSTVAGMLGGVLGRPIPAFSIGFEADGYDEMNYARIAARHFRAEHHEYYVTPGDLVQGMPRVAAHYDQPFGNSSAVPSYYCALVAAEHGVEKLLAGDGGDELFGGNTRYAKQRVFDAYYAIPRALRERLIEPFLTNVPAVRRLPVLRKAASYVEQARVPMPARMETYNLLMRFGAKSVFTESFLERIDPNEPAILQQAVYLDGDAPSIVERMLRYDWRFTLADNDLPKVVGSAQLAGQTVGFPLLDDELVDLSLRLASQLKLRGLTLRYFFKRALRNFLPREILRKRKHGFGLPFGPWLTRDSALQALARSSLQRLIERRLIQPSLVADLMGERLSVHAGYYGEMIWVLTMLELWLEARAPAFSVD